jgi:hypothetical protein
MDRDNNKDDEFQFSDPEEFSFDDMQHDEAHDDKAGETESGDDSTMSGHEDSFDYTMASQDGGFVEKYIMPYKKPIIIGASALVVLIAGVVIIKMRGTTPAPTAKPTKVAHSKKDSPAPVTVDTSGLEGQITRNEKSITGIKTVLSKIDEDLKQLATEQKQAKAAEDINSQNISNLSDAIVTIQGKLKAKPAVVKFNPKVRYSVDSCWNGRAWLVGKQGGVQKYINVTTTDMIPDYGAVIHVYGGNTANSPCLVQTFNKKTKREHTIRYGVNDS